MILQIERESDKKCRHYRLTKYGIIGLGECRGMHLRKMSPRLAFHKNGVTTKTYGVYVA